MAAAATKRMELTAPDQRGASVPLPLHVSMLGFVVADVLAAFPREAGGASLPFGAPARSA